MSNPNTDQSASLRNFIHQWSNHFWRIIKWVYRIRHLLKDYQKIEWTCFLLEAFERSSCPSVVELKTWRNSTINSSSSRFDLFCWDLVLRVKLKESSRELCKHSKSRNIHITGNNKIHICMKNQCYRIRKAAGFAKLEQNQSKGLFQAFSRICKIVSKPLKWK